MMRSTQAQKAERLNAAHGLLASGISMAEAAMALSREFGLSRRQAYRYLEEAQTVGHVVAVVEASVAITFKLPGSIIRDLRRHAAASGATLSETVTRALLAYLATEREHG